MRIPAILFAGCHSGYPKGTDTFCHPLKLAAIYGSRWFHTESIASQRRRGAGTALDLVCKTTTS